MTKYEYKIEPGVSKEGLVKVLNGFGKNGWECFEVKKEYDDYYGASYTLYLKRVIEDDKNYFEHIDKYDDEFLKAVGEKWLEEYPLTAQLYNILQKAEKEQK